MRWEQRINVLAPAGRQSRLPLLAHSLRTALSSDGLTCGKGIVAGILPHPMPCAPSGTSFFSEHLVYVFSYCLQTRGTSAKQLFTFTGEFCWAANPIRDKRGLLESFWRRLEGRGRVIFHLNPSTDHLRLICLQCTFVSLPPLPPPPQSPLSFLGLLAGLSTSLHQAVPPAHLSHSLPGNSSVALVWFLCASWVIQRAAPGRLPIMTYLANGMLYKDQQRAVY